MKRQQCITGIRVGPRIFSNLIHFYSVDPLLPLLQYINTLSFHNIFSNPTICIPFSQFCKLCTLFIHPYNVHFLLCHTMWALFFQALHCIPSPNHTMCTLFSSPYNVHYLLIAWHCITPSLNPTVYLHSPSHTTCTLFSQLYKLLPLLSFLYCALLPSNPTCTSFPKSFL